MIRRFLGVSSCVSALLLLMGADARAQSKCAGTKIKASGKKAACLLKLEAGEAKKGAPAPADKVQKCIGKFTATFAKAEAKGGCITTADTASIEAKVDAFVIDVDSEVGVGGINGCQATKLKATGKKAACLLKLEANQAAKGVPPPGDKVAKCKSKFSSTFAKAEVGGGCATTSDTVDIEAKVEAFVADVDDELSMAPLPTCSGDPCGTCGNGECVVRCQNGNAVCVAGVLCIAVSGPCDADADCSSGQTCVVSSNTADCGVAGLSGCCVPCP